MAKPLRLPGVEEQRVLDELEIQVLLDGQQQERWNQLIVEQHYLRSAKLVGEQLRYVASYQGQWVAVLGWSAPAWHLKPRDQWINWSEEQLQARLHFLAQNSRFVLGATVGGLASAAWAPDSGAGKLRRWAAFSWHDLQGFQLDDAGADGRLWSSGGGLLCRP